jgi:hypothetical protein
MSRIRFEQDQSTNIICITAWMNLGDEQDVCEMRMGTIESLNETSTEVYWYPAQGSEILCISMSEQEAIFLKMKEVNKDLSDRAIIEEVFKDHK